MPMLCDLLRAARDGLGLSQTAVVAALGCDYSSYSNWETNAVLPRRVWLTVLAEVLDADLEALMLSWLHSRGHQNGYGEADSQRAREYREDSGEYFSLWREANRQHCRDTMREYLKRPEVAAHRKRYMARYVQDNYEQLQEKWLQKQELASIERVAAIGCWKIGGSSRFRGVYWHATDHTWHAQLGRAHLGMFDVEEDAARAYDKASVEKFGSRFLTNERLGLLLPSDRQPRHRVKRVTLDPPLGLFPSTRWTVLEVGLRTSYGACAVRARCLCGTERLVLRANLLRLQTRSCGCVRANEV